MEPPREAIEAERVVLRQLERLDLAPYELRTQVKLGGGSVDSVLLLDALLYSEIDQFSDVIVEIKATPSLGSAPLRRFIDGAIALQQRYSRRTGRSAIVWLVVVSDEGSVIAREYAQRAEREWPDLRLSLTSKDAIDELRPPFRT